MEHQWSQLQVILTSLVGISVGLLMVRTFRKKKLPPGPTPWPLFGNFPQFGVLPHQNCQKLAEQYGPLIFLKLGSRNSVVASSPELAEEFLKKNDAIWASRPPSTAGKLIMYGHLDIVLAEYGPRWRNARKMFVQDLLTSKRLSSFQQSRKEEIMSAINQLTDDCCGGTKAARMDLVVWNMGIKLVTRMFFYEGILDKNRANTMKEDVIFQDSEFIIERLKIGVYYLGDYVPLLDWFDPGGYKKMAQGLAKKLDEFYQSILDEHRLKHKKMKEETTQHGAHGAEDMVDALLLRTESDGHHLSDTEMKAIMQDLFIAGTDTTVRTEEWGLSELLRNPRTLKKAQVEMDSMVGRERLVEESDLPNLPYLLAIVKEILRLHPVAPLLMEHMSTDECEVQGYRIPAKTRLFVNMYAIQRDPKLWERPLDFYPERFLGSSKDVHGQHFDLLPFGTGRRSCPGKKLGLLQLQYTLALFIQTCDWSLPGNMKPEDIDMEEGLGLVLHKQNPLQAIATPRLPKHVLLDFHN